MTKKLSKAEAGRLGGQKTAMMHGNEFFSQIGREGGITKAVNRKKLVAEA